MENNYRKRGRPRNPRSSDAPDAPDPSPRKRGRPSCRNSITADKGTPYDVAGVVTHTNAMTEIGSSPAPTHAQARSSSPSRLPPVMGAATPGDFASPMHTKGRDYPEAACTDTTSTQAPLSLSTSGCSPSVLANPGSSQLITDRAGYVPGSISRKRGRPRIGNRAAVANPITCATPVIPPTTMITPDTAAVPTPVLPSSSPAEHNSTSTTRKAESYRRTGRPRKVAVPQTQEACFGTLGDNNGEASGSKTAGNSTPSSSGTRKYLKPWNFGGPTESCEFCSAVVWKEEAVGEVSNNTRPKFNICCQKGKVKLTKLRDPPELLNTLLAPAGGHRSSEFRRLIRSYNSIYAFTSMGGKVDNAVNKGGSPYCFRLGGQNHHNIGSLHPPLGKQPRFMQLYFHDTQNELTNRVTSLNGEGKNSLQPDIVEGLSQMMYEHNAVAKLCKMARERISLL